MSPLRQNPLSNHTWYFVSGIVICAVFFVVALRGDHTEIIIGGHNLTTSVAAVASVVPEVVREVSHITTPDAVKAIYMSACVAATPSFRAELVQLVEETELNSIIIDIKDFSGTISFPTGLAGDKGTGCRIADLPEFIRTLHEKGIYVIGRITVFQDPFYATLHPELAVKKKSNQDVVWSDRKGIHFIEVGARPYWDYIVELARVSHSIGFDELNFDYIRFPSDGDMEDIYFPFSNDLIATYPVTWRAEALEKFFMYLEKEMDQIGVVTSADIFGMTTTSLNQFDLYIGQVLERTVPYFDYVAPMVYPSHYPANFNGWVDPNDYPGELIQYTMQGAIDKVEIYKNATSTSADIASKISKDQLRPWIQDFDYGGDYDAADVRAQIDAVYSIGLDSWMLWAPSNRYTAEALKKE